MVNIIEKINDDIKNLNNKYNYLKNLLTEDIQYNQLENNQLENNLPPANFYVVIPTIKKYDKALEICINSLPNEWKNKYIVVYQNEHYDLYNVFEDGHIEVKIRNNLYELGTYVGVQLLFNERVIPEDSIFLFIHDTCKFIDNGRYSVKMVYNIINSFLKYNEIYWLAPFGQCNLCLIKKNAITHGNSIYNKFLYITKKEAYSAELDPVYHLSPKTFPFSQYYDKRAPITIDYNMKIYSENNRQGIIIQSINLIKFIYHANPGTEHIDMP